MLSIPCYDIVDESGMVYKKKEKIIIISIEGVYIVHTYNIDKHIYSMK